MKKLLLFIFALSYAMISNAQDCSDLFISEYVEGWSNNKALELYNPTSETIDLSNYRITRYSNGNIPPPDDQWFVNLSGTIAPYRTVVLVLDKRDPNGTGQDAPVWDDLQDRADMFLTPDYDVSWAMYFNGDDAIALEKTDGTFVDIFGKYGERPTNEEGTYSPVGGWSTVYPHNDGQGVIVTRDHTMIRKADVGEGVTTNPAVFDPLMQWDTLIANTFDHLNWHESNCRPGNIKPVFGQASYSFELPEDSPAGTVVGTVTADDEDGDYINYFITWGNPYHPFALNKSTGEITVDNPEQVINSQYELTIQATDGTEPIETTVTISISSSIAEISDFANVRVYPNPVTDGKLEIMSSGNLDKIEIYSIDGKVAKSLSDIYHNTAIEMDLSGLTSGLYFIRLYDENGSMATQKLMIN